jgi:hypothetical protein
VRPIRISPPASPCTEAIEIHGVVVELDDRLADLRRATYAAFGAPHNDPPSEMVRALGMMNMLIGRLRVLATVTAGVNDLD